MLLTDKTESPRWHGFAIAALLVAFYLALRLPHLRAMPVFCDEATYLRWAQLVRADPIHNLFVSMEDAKLPLHYWLLAMAYSITADPILSGRLLSVIFGAASIPAIIALCHEMQRLGNPNEAPSPRQSVLHPTLAGCVLVLFMITSPLVASYQRMALAEPLLLLEAIVLAWASMRLARRLCEAPRTRERIIDATLLGVIWGATLLTKQNFSYLLWMFPPLAMTLHLGRATWKNRIALFLPNFALATLVGILLFVPVLFTSSTLPLHTRLFYKASFVASDTLPRWTSFLWNCINLLSPRAAGHAKWWPHDPAMPLDDGTLYVYLTPPVFFMAIAGTFYLLRRRKVVPLVLFGGWCVLLLGTLAANTNFIRTRYAFLGIAPLIFLAAAALAELLAAIGPRRTLRPILLAACLAWPLFATVSQSLDYRAPTLLVVDRAEYLSSPSAGPAAQAAVRWLASESEKHPLTVITASGFGLDNDLPWLYLRGKSAVQLFCTDQPLVTRKSPLTLGVEQWYPARTAPVTIAPHRPIYQLAPMSLSPENRMACAPPLHSYGANARLVTMFPNPPIAPGMAATCGLGIIELDSPHAAP